MKIIYWTIEQEEISWLTDIFEQFRHRSTFPSMPNVFW